MQAYQNGERGEVSYAWTVIALICFAAAMITVTYTFRQEVNVQVEENKTLREELVVAYKALEAATAVKSVSGCVESPGGVNTGMIAMGIDQDYYRALRLDSGGRVLLADSDIVRVSKEMQRLFDVNACRPVPVFSQHH